MKNQWLVITLMNCADASTMLLQALYYSYIKDWKYLHLIYIFFNIIMLLCLTAIPESPRYFYTNRRFDQARKVLRRVARFNRSDLTEAELDGIVFYSEEEESRSHERQQSNLSVKVHIESDDIEEEKANGSMTNDSSRESSVYSRSSMNIDSLFLKTYANDMGSLVQTEADVSIGEDAAMKRNFIDFSQMLKIPYLKKNFYSLMMLLSISSFGFYLLDFHIEREEGDLI